MTRRAERVMVSEIAGSWHRGSPGWMPRITTEFLWFADDPLAVILIFQGREEWTFSRDLLIDGQYIFTGSGDVRIGPIKGSADLYLLLRSPDGIAELNLNGDTVAEFLHRTCEIVPVGAENYEITAGDRADGPNTTIYTPCHSAWSAQAIAADLRRSHPNPGVRYEVAEITEADACPDCHQPTIQAAGQWWHHIGRYPVECAGPPAQRAPTRTKARKL